MLVLAAKANAPSSHKLLYCRAILCQILIWPEVCYGIFSGTFRSRVVSRHFGRPPPACLLQFGQTRSGGNQRLSRPHAQAVTGNTPGYVCCPGPSLNDGANRLHRKGTRSNFSSFANPPKQRSRANSGNGGPNGKPTHCAGAQEQYNAASSLISLAAANEYAARSIQRKSYIGTLNGGRFADSEQAIGHDRYQRSVSKSPQAACALGNAHHLVGLLPHDPQNLSPPPVLAGTTKTFERLSGNWTVRRWLALCLGP